MVADRKGKIRRWIYFGIATICLALAYIGTVLPGVPGTPFILLTAYFYLRSSERMYRWLLRQKLFAQLINKFRENKKMPLKLKVFALIPFWISVIVAEFIFVSKLWIGLAIALAGIFLSILVIRLKELNLQE
jgi:uncharacterized membrane protein YbaN (DUF454 family)